MGVEELLNGLMEAFVLALGGGLAWTAGDRFNPKVSQVPLELGDLALTGQVECCAVVGQEPGRGAVAADRCRDDRDRCLCGLRPGDMRGQDEP